MSAEITTTEKIATKPVKIDAIESGLMRFPQANCSVTHTFFPGIYVRELHLKAGTLAIGHYQNFEHANVFIKGKVQMLDDCGKTVGIIEAPMAFKAPPGRKVGYILEDTVWQNVYSTDITDVEMLEAMLFSKSEQFIQQSTTKYFLDYVDNEKVRTDFKDTVKLLGYTEEKVHEESVNEDDLIPLPFGTYKVKVAISTIDGLGVIATADIDAGERIGIAKAGNKRTPLGRYANHSSAPNARMEVDGDIIYLTSTKFISGTQGCVAGEEVTVNYEEVIKLVRG